MLNSKLEVGMYLSIWSENNFSVFNTSPDTINVSNDNLNSIIFKFKFKVGVILLI